MKYQFVLAALASLALGAHANKPTYICETTGAEPLVELGGYNVPLEDYGGFSQENGVAMVNDLWRKTVLDTYEITVQPAKDFDPVTLDGLGPDEYFAFEKKNGHFRGIGVEGGDPEVSDDEGLYISFGGMETYELVFGVRALFVENPNSLVFEKGLITLYKDGSVIADHTSLMDLTFQASNAATVDGQEYFVIKSEVPFDALSFVTYSHSDHAPDNAVGSHDYFLEYMDICRPTPTMNGDPHIRTWSGTKYDFHGVCDLVLLQNPDFENGLGMDIHVRTRQVKEFSYISSAVLRIGDETLEVMGDLYENLYWINGEANGNLDKGISGYSISSRKVNSKQNEFIVHFGTQKSIILKTYKKMVRVNIEGATKESFGASLGLLGTFDGGKFIARDGATKVEDINEFGVEWQVLPSEDMLFHNVEGPQAPEKCYIPVATNLRRRLGEENISENDAELACAGVNKEDFELCVFDVMATGDMELAGAY